MAQVGRTNPKILEAEIRVQVNEAEQSGRRQGRWSGAKTTKVKFDCAKAVPKMTMSHCAHAEQELLKPETQVGAISNQQEWQSSSKGGEEKQSAASRGSRRQDIMTENGSRMESTNGYLVWHVRFQRLYF